MGGLNSIIYNFFNMDMHLFLASYVEYDVNDDIHKDFRLFIMKDEAEACLRKWQKDFEEEKKDVTFDDVLMDEDHIQYLWDGSSNCLDIAVTEVQVN